MTAAARAASAQRAAPSLPGRGPTSHEQPPPPVARPKTPREPPPPPPPAPVDVDVEPVAPVLVVADVDPPAPLLLLVLVCTTAAHSPVAAAHAWPSGQRTPAHGQLPHAPVTGSQQEPSAHDVGVQRLGTHAGGAFVRSQVSVAAQAGLQSATHAPLAQISPALQTLPAHESTQAWSVKSALGLHSWPVGQVSARHGLSMQVPPLHAFPQPSQG